MRGLFFVRKKRYTETRVAAAQIGLRQKADKDKMEAVRQIIDAEQLDSIIYIPDEMKHRQVEVIVLPVMRTSEKTRYREKQKTETTMERIARFRKKHNNDTFIAHLKQKLAEGRVFDFNAEKIINAAEIEKERQERYQMEKRAWQDTSAENIRGSNL
jgi:hypothetical protein